MMPSSGAQLHLDSLGSSAALWSGFIQSAKTFPQRPALWVDGRVATYAELCDAALRIAATLQAVRAEPESAPLTAIFAQRSSTAFAGVLGALLAGDGYVPLNPSFPIERSRAMLVRSDCRALIVDAGALDQLDGLLEGAEHRLTVLLPDGVASGDFASRWPQHRFIPVAEQASAGTWRQPDVDPDAVAYLLFTSGSTGAPKGVMVAHRNVRAFVDYMVDIYNVTEHDRFSQMFDMTFDLSVFDMFVCWERGAMLCCPSKKTLIKPGQFIADHELTIWFSTPSTAIFMKQLGELQAGRYPSLRLSLFCGEPLPASSVASWGEAAPNSILENLYGPTELTIACTRYRWDDESSQAHCELGVVPIGDPYPGMEVLVADENLVEVGPGMTGELLMRGPQMTLGYWRDPAKTSAAFVVPPGRDAIFYRTGDRVRRADGARPMTHLGRTDHQVKVLGYRVELGEIEAVLRDCCRLDGVVAVGWPATASGFGGVEAFVEAPSIPHDLRERAAARLPEYMVPRRIHALERLPRNSNGKYDRIALVQMLEQGKLDAEATAPPDAPPGTSEGRLLETFRMLLRSPTATLDSSFESLGGDSLSYVTVYLALEEIIGEPPLEWTSMSVRELGRLTHKPSGGAFKNIESVMLFRALAICAIVAEHFQIVKLTDATGVLMFVSGVMFGNIQANEIVKTNTSASIIRFFKGFLLQYFVLTTPNVGKTVLHGAPAWAALLLTSDITNWKSGFVQHAEGYWYVHCLFHILLIFIIVHAIFKRILPGKSAVFATLFVCCGIGLVGRDVVPYVMDPAFHSVDPSYMSPKYSWPLLHKYSLFYFSPMIHIATFAIAALSTMVTGVRKFFLAGVFICYALASFGGQGEFTTVSLLAGGLWIMFVPKTPVPRAIVPFVYNLAGASMFIYLLHYYFLNFTEHWSIRPPVAFVWAGGIALGVAAWRLWNLGEQILPQMFGRIGAWRSFRRLNSKMGSRPGSRPPPTLSGMA